MDCLMRYRMDDDNLFLRAADVIDLLIEADKRAMTPQDVAEKLTAFEAERFMRRAS